MLCNHDSICTANDALPVSPLAVDDAEKIPSNNGNSTIRAGNMVQSKTHRKLAKLLNPSSRSCQDDVTFVVLVVVVATLKKELASDSESSDEEESAEELSAIGLQYKTLGGTNDDDDHDS